MAINKNIIRENASKNKKFMRILKELRMYKRYFQCVNEYGHKDIHFNATPTSLSSLVMNAFCWIHDKSQFSRLWVYLHQLLAEQEFTLRQNQKIPIKQLRESDRWIKIENGIKEMQQ